MCINSWYRYKSNLQYPAETVEANASEAADTKEETKTEE